MALNLTREHLFLVSLVLFKVSLSLLIGLLKLYTIIIICTIIVAARHQDYESSVHLVFDGIHESEGVLQVPFYYCRLHNRILLMCFIHSCLSDCRKFKNKIPPRIETSH